MTGKELHALKGLSLLVRSVELCPHFADELCDRIAPIIQRSACVSLDAIAPDDRRPDHNQLRARAQEQYERVSAVCAERIAQYDAKQ